MGGRNKYVNIHNLISQDQTNSKRVYLKKQGRVSKALLKLDNKKSET